MEKEKRRERWLRKMKDRYRLVFLNDGTFEEKFSLRLTRWNVLIGLGTLTILLFLFTFLIIAHTGLRYWVPGYTDVSDERLLYHTQLRLDSQDQVLLQYEQWVNNFQRILKGEEIEDPFTHVADDLPDRNYDTIEWRRIPEDSILRAEFSMVDPYALRRRLPDGTTQGVLFFPPIKGTVINGFNPRTGHYAVDIAARQNEAVKATLDGTVILSTWSSETGWTIVLQHTNNLISVYKHNSSLLRRQGEYVKAGDPIAMYGGTGSLSTGRHLHFELWYHGNPIDPQDYIIFE